MRLVANSLWNLLGGVVPAVAALLTVPVVIAHLGTDHYGVLTLVTSIVGYFALLDINATTGSVKFLAEFKARNDAPRIRQLLSFGLAIYIAIGAAGGAAIAAFAEPLARSVFQVPLALQATSVAALRWGALAFFFAQVQTYLQSVPQSLQRYDVSARSEAVFGSLASLSTLVVVLLGGGLPEIMLARAAVSVFNVGFLGFMVTRLLPGLAPALPGRDVAGGLMSFSLYSYLSRFASVTYANADKLIIGGFVDMRSLALYSVPFLLVNRVFALVYRLGHVMLPEASRLAATARLDELRSTYLTSARYLMYLNAALSCLLIVFARELLHYWAGAAFGPAAARVLGVLALAVLVDSFTNLPSLVNDGLGRPRNTGLFAFGRAVAALLASWLAVQWGGIAGVAWAQLAVSCCGAAAFLTWVHGRVLPATLAQYLRAAFVPCVPPLVLALALGAALSERSPLTLPAFFGAAALAVALLATYGWLVVLGAHHRDAITLRFRRAGSP